MSVPRILALTRFGTQGASSRYRTYSYLPYLREHGFSIDVLPLLDNDYLERKYGGGVRSIPRVAKAFLNRAVRLLRARKYDLVWIEKEALPWIPHCLESLLLRKSPKYVLDYDDALFHRYDTHASSAVRWALGRKIGALMRGAAMVIAGNEYIAAHARDSGAQDIRLLPSVVDLTKYEPTAPPNNERLNIGWIGTPVTARLLQTIQPALRQVCRDGRATLTTVGSGPLTIEGVPVQPRAWSEDTETAELRDFDVGIMPLSDSAFEKGKCGLKLIQYMASGRPVVGTPVGVNQDLITHGVNGYQASTQEDWVRSLNALKSSVELRRRMGQSGRKLVEREYSLRLAAPRLEAMLHDAARTTSIRRIRRAA